MENAYKILVGTPKRKRPLKRPERRWEDNIEIDRPLLMKWDLRIWTGFIWLRIGTNGCLL
jgi:hypothetical protein